MNDDDTKYAKNTALPSLTRRRRRARTTYVISNHSVSDRFIRISSRVSVSVVCTSSVALATGIRCPVVGLSYCLQNIYIFKTIRSGDRFCAFRFSSTAITVAAAAAARSPICVATTRACISGKFDAISVPVPDSGVPSETILFVPGVLRNAFSRRLQHDVRSRPCPGVGILLLSIIHAPPMTEMRSLTFVNRRSAKVVFQTCGVCAISVYHHSKRLVFRRTERLDTARQPTDYVFVRLIPHVMFAVVFLLHAVSHRLGN